MRLKNIPGARDVVAVSEYVVQDPERYKGKWQEVFGNDHPVELEIGIGKGKFLMDLAAEHPEKNFLGMEMYSSVLLRAIQKAEQRAAGAETPLPVSVHRRPARPDNCNFRLLRFDAAGLSALFEKGEISGIYLNFSDPWPKERHADRRLTSGRFLRRYEEVLPAGGKLVFKTDNRGLFDFSLEQIRENGWELIYHTFDLHGVGRETEEESDGTGPGMGEDADRNGYQPETGRIMTEYEEKFVSEGKPICVLEAVCP